MSNPFGVKALEDAGVAHIMTRFWRNDSIVESPLQSWSGDTSRVMSLTQNRRSGADEWFSYILTCCRMGNLSNTQYNFLHGFPVFCVSIGLMLKDTIEHAVVYDPIKQELFTASNGQGAHLDGKRIRVSGEKFISRSLIGTGFPYRKSNKNPDHYMAMLKQVINKTAGVRRPGAAAIDLCYVAAGRLDGFWETGLSIWDIAAGALIIQESGGIITDINGSSNYLETGDVLCGTPRIHSKLQQLLIETSHQDNN